MDIKTKIKDEIKNNSIVLYMIGTKNMPACGFSNSDVQILNHYGVEYLDVNILEDPQIRIKLSEYSNWPTIPQLYVKGEFVGGCDIVREMQESGELGELFAEKGVAVEG